MLKIVACKTKKIIEIINMCFKQGTIGEFSPYLIIINIVDNKYKYKINIK
jgi:hypothetical protein